MVFHSHLANAFIGDLQIVLEGEMNRSMEKVFPFHYLYDKNGSYRQKAFIHHVSLGARRIQFFA